MNKPTKIFLVVTLAAIVAGGLLLLQKQRAHAAESQLADMIPQITFITVYDIDGHATLNSNVLVSATSAAFPVDVFGRAASSATREGGMTIWKGSTTAVITLRDGTQRHARFSYYGGFFTVDGLSGRFVARGAGSSEFQEALLRVMQVDFFPKRQKRNANAS